MLMIAISMAMLATASGEPPTLWLNDLLASPTAKRLTIARTKTPNSARATTAASSKPAGTQRGEPGVRDVNLNVPTDPVRLANLQAENEARQRVALCLDAGRYEEAYASADAFRRERPDLARGVDDLVAECANLTGRYSEAYGLLLRTIRILEPRCKNRKMPPHYLLSISLASAGLGQTYPGQADYCRGQVDEGLKQRCRSDQLDGRLARNTDPQTTAVLSCLALGLEWRQMPYLEMALKLDPTNVIAADGLISYYTARGRIADLHRMATAMLKILRAGDPRRAEFERALAWDQ